MAVEYTPSHKGGYHQRRDEEGRLVAVEKLSFAIGAHEAG